MQKYGALLNGREDKHRLSDISLPILKLVKLLKTFQNYWSEISQIVLECVKIGEKKVCQKVKIYENGYKWVEMGKTISKLVKMGQRGPTGVK